MSDQTTTRSRAQPTSPSSPTNTSANSPSLRSARVWMTFLLGIGVRVELEAKGRLVSAKDEWMVVDCWEAAEMQVISSTCTPGCPARHILYIDALPSNPSSLTGTLYTSLSPPPPFAYTSSPRPSRPSACLSRTSESAILTQADERLAYAKYSDAAIEYVPGDAG
ncbi:hypothetical protein BD779DRAFT_1679514 [Infundibulicybe gibba]|nr:hypothetical protein BD779DRAFT_1679514 [Infundibulicybe gibba]